MLHRGVETETVFTSPDVRESEEVRELLQAHGMGGEIEAGPDPVTGLGGGVFGGASPTFFNVEVPRAHAERARKLLAWRAGPGLLPARSSPPAEEPGPDRSWFRRHARWIVAIWFFAPIAVVLRFAEGQDRLIYSAFLVVCGLVVALAVLWARRRSSG